MPFPATIEYRPLGLWPAGKPRTKSPQRSPFKSTPGVTLAKLREELGAIHARNCVIECDAPDSQFNRDGTLRANARLNGAAIILRFTDRHGSAVAMPCDTYREWIDNVRAIALTLEKLRAIDRYGVTKSGEQYAGFRAIPAQTGADSVGIRTVDDAAAFLAAHGGHMPREVLSSVTTARYCWRLARNKSHPDNGGNDTEFHKTTVAAKLIAAHFGVPVL